MKSNDTAVLIVRLCGLLDRENVALLHFEQRTFDDLLAEKVRILRDISKLHSLGPDGDLGDGARLKPLIQEVIVKLEHNMRILEVHAGAIGQVVGTIAAALEAVKSDGTYQRLC